MEWRAEGTYGYSYDRTDNIWLANTGEANSKAGQPVARRQYWNGNNWTLRTVLNYKFDIQKNIDLILWQVGKLNILNVMKWK